MRRTTILRIISLIVLMCMLPVGSCEVLAAPMDETLLCDKDFLMLKSLGILSDEDLPFLTVSVSRSDFVRLAVKASGIDAMSYSQSITEPFIYSDVKDNKEYIYTAYKMGYIDLPDNAKFNPYDNITMAQAAKILTTISGYAAYACAKGGYPSGYLAVAYEIDLFDGCDIQNADEINFRTAFKMLRNLLDCRVYDVETVQNGEVTYANNNSDTMLSKYFGIYYVEGIVSANMYTSITYTDGVGKGFVQVGDKLYLDRAECGSKIGRHIKGYYKAGRDVGMETLLYVEESLKNKILTVGARDIEKISTAKTKLSYYNEKNELRSMNIKKTASLIYNSKFEEITKARLTPSKGDVTLIDNNSDNTADVIIVNNYNKTIWVNGVSNEGTVSDSLSSYTISLDEDEDDYDFEIIKEGVHISTGEIMPEDVVTIAIPDTVSGLYNIRVIVQSTTEEGVLTAYSPDDGKVWINDNEFYISEETFKNLSLGQEGMFYYDAFGEIVARNEYETVIYGYLYKLVRKGIGPVQAKIFTENNRWVIVDFEKKIDFNTNRNYSSTDLFGEHSLFPEGELEPQIVAYRVSRERKISLLMTAEIDEAVLGKQTPLQSADRLRLSYKSDSEYYRKEPNSLEAHTYFNAKTKIFMIPDETFSDFEEEIMVCDAAGLVPNRAYKNVRVYNRSANGIAQLVSLQKNVDSYVGLGFMVVTGIGYGTNSDTGNDVCVIKGYQNGVRTDIKTTDISVKTDVEGFECEDLECGDIIQYEIERDGNVRKIYVKNDYSKNEEKLCGTFSYASSSLYNNYNFISGTVKSMNLSEDMFTLNYSSGTVALSLAASPKVYRLDMEEKKLEAAGKGDIMGGKRAFISMRYLQPQMIIIYD